MPHNLKVDFAAEGQPVSWMGPACFLSPFEVGRCNAHICELGLEVRVFFFTCVVRVFGEKMNCDFTFRTDFGVRLAAHPTVFLCLLLWGDASAAFFVTPVILDVPRP